MFLPANFLPEDSCVVGVIVMTPSFKFCLAIFFAKNLEHPTISACSLYERGAFVQHWRCVRSSRYLYFFCCGFLDGVV